MLVGRSHECDNPAWVQALPRCSEPAFPVTVSSRAIDAEVRRRIAAGEELYRVDTSLIRSLHPDLVIAQSHCEVCAVTPADLERGGDCLPTLALSAASVEEIFHSIRQIGDRLGLADRAQSVIEQETLRLQKVRNRTAHLPRPTVVMLEWTDPLFSMGNWGPELLEIANGELLFGSKGEYSATVPPERLLEADPDILIIAPCGFSLPRALEDRRVLERIPGWNSLRAVQHRKVAFADGNLYFNRSGMTISRTAEIIAEILQGETFDEPSQGNAWCWSGDVL